MPEAIEDKYGTPAKVIAFVMAGTPRPLAGAQVLSEEHPDDYTCLQQVRLSYKNGDMREDTLKFHRDTDGWKQVVSASMVDRAIEFLRGTR